jgi:hypothetical protein
MSYIYTKQIQIKAAFDNYLRNNVQYYDGMTCQSDQLTIITTQELTEEQQTQLTILINNYVDPSYFLELSRTQALPLVSIWADSQNELALNGNTILQTYIFTGNNNESDNEVLDGIKTIIEYRRCNLQLFKKIEIFY